MRMSSSTSLQPPEPASPASAAPAVAETALAERPGAFLVRSLGARSAATLAEALR